MHNLTQELILKILLLVRNLLKIQITWKSIYQFLSVVEGLIRHIFVNINIKKCEKVAGVKGLEPSTYRVTGDRSNQLSYTPTLMFWWAVKDSNL